MFLTKWQPVLSKQCRVQFGWDPCIDVSGNQITIELRQLVPGAAQSCLFIGPEGVKSPWSIQVCKKLCGTAGVPRAAQTWSFPCSLSVSFQCTGQHPRNDPSAGGSQLHPWAPLSTAALIPPASPFEGDFSKKI